MVLRLPPEQKTEKTEFLSFFYKYCMHVLTAPLLANTADEKNSKGDWGLGLVAVVYSSAADRIQGCFVGKKVHWSHIIEV